MDDGCRESWSIGWPCSIFLLPVIPRITQTSHITNWIELKWYPELMGSSRVVIQALGSLAQGDCCESEASLGYKKKKNPNQPCKNSQTLSKKITDNFFGGGRGVLLHFLSLAQCLWLAAAHRGSSHGEFKSAAQLAFAAHLCSCSSCTD